MHVQAAVSYALLYPPVQSTLLCLSKLYRAVDPKIFSGLAQEAVSACALSIQQAARQVRKDILEVHIVTGSVHLQCHAHPKSIYVLPDN